MTKPIQDASSADVDTPKANANAEPATATRKPAGRAVWMGTAVGIGSAAIVAALLYANKKRG
ncbi:MAG TPA: hypothetical protein VJ762_04070 [Sphingobium sp.]|nr:hypothetical protein [Sphingobium sp.]